MNDSIRQRLRDMADEKYRAFASSLLPGCGQEILGVRLPLLRTLAREIARGDYRNCMAGADPGSFEETMILGMVIGYAKAGVEEKLSLVAAFVPRISNWSVCDSFCTGLTFTRDHRDRVWDFLMPYLSSGEEYPIRFVVVMLLTYYIDDVFLDRVFAVFDRIHHEGYYVKMAVAWAVSICYIKSPERTKTYLDSCRLDDETFNKSLRKITESLRVDKAAKDMIRKMRRKRKNVCNFQVFRGLNVFSQGDSQ